MAEGVGFEPTVGLTPRSISSRVLVDNKVALRTFCAYIKGYGENPQKQETHS
jgi:hypothetical protein